MTDFEREYRKLNQAQKQAVDTIEGPLIVIAGPGSGKTQLLGMRVANILRLTDTAANNILCLTFTEAAANNLRVRLAELIGQAAHRVEIYTFHGFGTHVIQNYPEYFYDNPLITPITELGEYEMLQQILGRLHHDNPLAKKIGSNYLHLKTIMSYISYFKRAGLSPNDLRIETSKSHAFFTHINHYLNIAYKDSPSSKNLDLYSDLYESIRNTTNQFPSIVADASAEDLSLAIEQVDTKSRYAKSITEWRDKWLVRTRTAHWEFKDQQKNQFLIALSSVYEDYETVLASYGFYTYDDMILRTNAAIEANEELKFILQERYQYVLVDEYQDTNGAQDKLLSLMADNIVNEGRPNLMVVGDDDQAIYRFQGAESSIMFDFIKRYHKPEVVILSESYRSGQELLSLAKSIIVNASDRLEAINPMIVKTLTSSGKVKSTEISQLASATETEYYLQIADQIADLIKSGSQPSSIAVLAPKHKYLAELVPYLISKAIPINYERREQILEQPRIVEILNLIELVWAVGSTRLNSIEVLLPKILAAPYFGLATTEWWQLAIDAQHGRQGWFEAIKSSDNRQLNNFCEAIKVIAMTAINQPFELVLAYLTGNKSIELSNGQVYDLPWRDYYFSESKISANPAEYIQFINQFNTLKTAFKDWVGENYTIIRLENFRTFIELYKSSGLPLLDESPYMSAKDAVNLMTAYKAKGLEWDNVIILNAHKDVWGPKTRNQNASFGLPSTLRWIEPVRDNGNDLIRLFYVAITRAKKRLYITSFNSTKSSKPTEQLEWLTDNPVLLPAVTLPTLTPALIARSFAGQWQNDYLTPTKDLKVLLQPLLTNYKLSATHLNEFLAVNKGGPKNFLFKYLLKVPDLLNPNAMYGNTVHKTLEFVHKQYIFTEKLPDIALILEYFNEKLKLNPLTHDELKFFRRRGKDNLSAWFELNQSSFSKSDIPEYNFRGENVTLGDARLTGKIDVIKKVENHGLTVIDYKTSAPLYSWQGNRGTSAINSYSYQRQLMFYKFLIDNSNSYGNKFKATQGQVKFITPDIEGKIVDLKYDFDKELLDELSRLIGIVWQKIMKLDFPDTDLYPATLTGIRTFEDDLLNNKI